MGKTSKPNGPYWVLILILATCAAVQVFLPPGDVTSAFAQEQMPATRPVLALVNFVSVLIVYGGLGLIGLRLSVGLGFAGVWDSAVSSRQRFLVPMAASLGIGIIFALVDTVFSKWHSPGLLPHPPFPTSLIASITAGIGEEIVFRLFFICLCVWLISKLSSRKRALDPAFGIATAMSAILFSVAHFHSGAILLGTEAMGMSPRWSRPRSYC